MAVKLLPFVLLFALSWRTNACSDSDEHHHLHNNLAVPSTLLTPPSRPLEWYDINIIHTTDSHGWLLGHQKQSLAEPNYSGDLGDFASFVTHMKEIAIQRDVDLLLVDSGDLHDGTGLTDGYPPGGVDGHDASQFIQQLPYDLMTIGNHELYDYAVTLDMYKNFAPKLNGRYLSSNVKITVADENGQLVNKTVGSQFAKFKTRKGRSVTALGVIFDFNRNAQNTTVQKVADMVKEKWFLDAIEEEPDFFLLIGHMPVAQDNWPLVFNAIRAKHATTPILILGGHTHIRDCVQFDGRSMALESGRYMETVGWMSAKLDEKGSTKNITFSRRYLDTNRVTYEFHSGKGQAQYDTTSGRSITQGLKDLAKKFNLDFLYGTAPHDFTLNQAPYPSDDNILSLFIEDVVPTTVAINNTRASIPNLIITNWGPLRSDIFSGPFTRNDQLTASPYPDYFLYIPNITFSIASRVVPALNGADQKRAEEEWEWERELYAKGEVGMRYRRWLEMSRRGVDDEKAANLTLGYVTKDSCPGMGDDTPHTPLPYYPVPNYVSSRPPNVTPETPIDLVFINFIDMRVVNVLNSLQSEKNYTKSDVGTYSPLLTNEVFGIYAQQMWK